MSGTASGLMSSEAIAPNKSEMASPWKIGSARITSPPTITANAVSIMGRNRTAPDFWRVRGNDGEPIQRIGAQPGGEVRLDRNEALRAHLGHLGLDMDYPGVEADLFGPKLRDFSGKDARPDAGEQAECEIGHQRAFPEGLHIGHEPAGLLGGDRRGRTAPMADTVIG